MNDLIARIDGWQYDVPADIKLHALLIDCRAEIEKLNGEKLSLKYELDVLNENGAGTIQTMQAEIQRLLTANEALKGLCDEYQAEIKQLEINHEFSKVVNLGLRNQNESLDAECARLEALREYVPMTRCEWDALIEQYSANEHNTPWRRYIEAEVIKRAGLRVKDKP